MTYQIFVTFSPPIFEDLPWPKPKLNYKGFIKW